jgi:hypothetical protein
MPRFLPTIFPALVMVLLFTKGAMALVSLLREPNALFTGPGEYRLHVPAPADYSVWHHTTASMDGVYAVRAPKLPDGAEITVEHDGVLVPTRPYSGTTVSGTSSGDRYSVLRFHAEEAGDYLIKVTGLADRHAFSVTRGNGIGPVFAVIGWFVAGGFAGMTALLFLILALARKFPKPAVPSMANG